MVGLGWVTCGYGRVVTFVATLGDRAPITCPDTPLMLIGRAPRDDGSYGRAAPNGPLPRDPNDASLWLAGQGAANACGTTTLAYILGYLLGDTARRWS
jgi:hypothetical protein